MVRLGVATEIKWDNDGGKIVISGDSTVVVRGTGPGWWGRAMCVRNEQKQAVAWMQFAIGTLVLPWPPRTIRREISVTEQGPGQFWAGGSYRRVSFEPDAKGADSLVSIAGITLRRIKIAVR